jgi:hypothetical protein
MAAFAKRAGHRNQHGDKPSYMPVRAKVVDTGTPTVKHGRYSNLYSIRGAMPRGLNLEVSGSPMPKRYPRFGVKG